MKSKTLLKGTLASAVTFLLLAPLAAQADVKIETLTHINEITGIANHDSDTTDYFQGDKKREENLRKFTGSVLGAWQKFRGEDKGSMDIDIFDVPANKHYNIDPQKKVYSVESIYDPNQPSKAPPEGGTTQQQKERQQQDKDVKVTKNEFTVKDTGQTKNINGFDTREYLVTWDLETLNTKTGEKGRDLMTTDTWTSTDPKLAKAREAEASYDRAYRKLMHEPEPDANAVYGMYGLGSGHVEVEGQDMKSAIEKLRTIKGLPVSTDVRWEAGGTDKDGKPTNDSDAGKDSGKSLDSALGSLFGHKSDDSDQKPQAAGTPGLTTIFSSHYEVKAVDTSPVNSSQFQTPSDYKLDD
ncbi:MAG TPA: hypothetical protein VLV87_04975 [Gammaproteobacteria bacterium]|nr:hypothetical protein [Gammaproteobacteria bacterium]